MRRTTNATSGTAGSDPTTTVLVHQQSSGGVSPCSGEETLFPPSPSWQLAASSGSSKECDDDRHSKTQRQSLSLSAGGGCDGGGSSASSSTALLRLMGVSSSSQQHHQQHLHTGVSSSPASSIGYPASSPYSATNSPDRYHPGAHPSTAKQASSDNYQHLDAPRPHHSLLGAVGSAGGGASMELPPAPLQEHDEEGYCCATASNSSSMQDHHSHSQNQSHHHDLRQTASNSGVKLLNATNGDAEDVDDEGDEGMMMPGGAWEGTAAFYATATSQPSLQRENASPSSDDDTCTPTPSSMSAADAVVPPRAPSESVDSRLGRVQQWGDDVALRVASGEYSLELSKEGEGGTYFVKSSSSSSGGSNGFVAVFKPSTEEIGQPGNPHGNNVSEKGHGFPVGVGYIREYLAYALDTDGRARVPKTVSVNMFMKRSDGGSSAVIGSLQEFIPNCSESWNRTPGPFSADDVRRIAIFDLRVLNCDRHGGNVLVRREDERSLVPIDHSYILPTCWADPEFEWMLWPQSKTEFTADDVAYIARTCGSTPAAASCSFLEETTTCLARRIGLEAAELFKLCCIVLHWCVVDCGGRSGDARAYTPREIAAFYRRETLTQPSGLELLLADVLDEFHDDGPAIDFALVTEKLPVLLPPKTKTR